MGIYRCFELCNEVMLLLWEVSSIDFVYSNICDCAVYVQKSRLADFIETRIAYHSTLHNIIENYVSAL